MPFATRQGRRVSLGREHIGYACGEFILLDWEVELLEEALPQGVSFCLMDDHDPMREASGATQLVTTPGLQPVNCSNALETKPQVKAKENRTPNREFQEGEAAKPPKMKPLAGGKAQSGPEATEEESPAKTHRAQTKRKEPGQAAGSGGEIAAQVSKGIPAGHSTKMPTQEKLVLQGKIDQLSDEQLDRVLDFLRPDLGLAGDAPGCEDCEVELDIDRLAPERQRDLIRFVDLELQYGSVAAESAATKQPTTPAFPVADPTATPRATPRRSDSMLHHAKEDLVLQMVDFGWK
mmetsp:Transcript_23309/g.55074  ORF Transcript_23309/g.55074 Transcript_23309/m.55074 type:complete len:292 (+) Transcript_23309:48-923(+)